jgi:Uma2 family endonuclease
MLTFMFDLSLLAPERVRPLRVDEYLRLADAGCFADERVELLDGFVVVMSPHSELHANVTARVTELLVRALPDGFQVRGQLPVHLGDHSMPEPDVAVVRRGTLLSPHPTIAVLVVEVARSSLRKDRELKAAIYARAGIPCYWLIDVDGGRVEVRTAPSRDDDAGYAALVTLTRGDTLGAPDLPGLTLAVDELLPPPA